MVEINEKSTAHLIISFFDETDIGVIPTTAKYSVIDKISGTVIRQMTTFDPIATSHTIQLSTTDNQIVNPDNNVEKRVVTVEWDYGDDGHGIQSLEYHVRNLQGI